MLCQECSELYQAEINTHVLEMLWAKAVKEWNSGQVFRDDMYGIPKKGGDYYDDVKEIMENSKHAKDVTKMMGKKVSPELLESKAQDAKSNIKALTFNIEDATKSNTRLRAKMSKAGVSADEKDNLLSAIEANDAMIQRLTKQRKEFEDELKSIEKEPVESPTLDDQKKKIDNFSIEKGDVISGELDDLGGNLYFVKEKAKAPLTWRFFQVDVKIDEEANVKRYIFMGTKTYRYQSGTLLMKDMTQYTFKAPKDDEKYVKQLLNDKQRKTIVVPLN
jgi:PIN domain nuclease of toxin-antitoxin system